MMVQFRLLALMRWWSDAKNALEAASPVGNHLLHLAVGLALWATLSRVARRRPQVTALLATAAAAVINELVDLAVERWPNRGDQLAEGAADLLWTLALPALLALAGHFRRQWERRPMKLVRDPV